MDCVMILRIASLRLKVLKNCLLCFSNKPLAKMAATYVLPMPKTLMSACNKQDNNHRTKSLKGLRARHHPVLNPVSRLSPCFTEFMAKP